MCMTSVIHIRIQKRVKERLEQLGVNISEEVRRFLELRLRQLEMERLIGEIKAELQEMQRVSDSVALIREDRESR